MQQDASMSVDSDGSSSSLRASPAVNDENGPSPAKSVRKSAKRERTRSDAVVDKAKKKQKGAAERREQARMQQRIGDLLYTMTDCKPAIKQTKSNGRLSGMQGDKLETLYSALHLMAIIMPGLYIFAKQQNEDHRLQHILQQSIKVAQDHVEAQRANRNQSFSLPPDSIMQDRSGRHRECRRDESRNAADFPGCVVHPGQKHHDGSLVTEWQDCHLLHQQQHLRGNMLQNSRYFDARRPHASLLDILEALTTGEPQRGSRGRSML